MIIFFIFILKMFTFAESNVIKCNYLKYIIKEHKQVVNIVFVLYNYKGGYLIIIDTIFYWFSIFRLQVNSIIAFVRVVIFGIISSLIVSIVSLISCTRLYTLLLYFKRTYTFFKAHNNQECEKMLLLFAFNMEFHIRIRLNTAFP